MDLLEPKTASADIVAAHYKLIAPIMEQLFGGSPLIWAAYPKGPKDAAQWHVHYFGHYTRLTAEHIERLHAIGALEFYSWFPTPDDFDHARFMRLLLNGPAIKVREAALAVRAMLFEEGREALPVLGGGGNIELWVPVSGAPTFERVRTYLHRFASKVVERHGDLISLEPNVHHDNHVHLHVANNAAGRWTIVPYGYRATTGRVATPIHWQELGEIDINGVPVAQYAARHAQKGDVFAAELATMRTAPPLPEEPVAQRMAMKRLNPKGALIAAAVNILDDGKTRSADEIWDIAHKRGMLQGNSSNIYDALLQYISRRIAAGRRPAIIKTEDRKFRINEPVDPWPDVPMPEPAKMSKETEALIARLHQTVEGDDPTAFEIAVCDAMSALGFLANHVGGRGAPDGYADAPLGTLGYRVMIECKSGAAGKKAPNVYEAAKFKEPYNARYCALFCLDPGAQEETMAEIKNHGVALWTVDDLAVALEQRFTLLEIELAFAPGAVAEDVIPDILWQRAHGEGKRVRIVAEIIRNSGWAAQCTAAPSNTPADAPAITEDAAMLLVDQELMAQGSHTNCTRSEVRAAFEWLSNDIVGAAVAATTSGLAVVDPLAGGPLVTR